MSPPERAEHAAVVGTPERAEGGDYNRVKEQPPMSPPERAVVGTPEQPPMSPPERAEGGGYNHAKERLGNDLSDPEGDVANDAFAKAPDDAFFQAGRRERHDRKLARDWYRDVARDLDISEEDSMSDDTPLSCTTPPDQGDQTGQGSDDLLYSEFPGFKDKKQDMKLDLGDLGGEGSLCQGGCAADYLKFLNYQKHMKQQGGQDYDPRKVFCPNLSYDLEDWELQIVFGPHGEIIDTKIMEHVSGFSKCVIVTYRDSASASAAEQMLREWYEIRYESECCCDASGDVADHSKYIMDYQKYMRRDQGGCQDGNGDDAADYAKYLDYQKHAKLGGQGGQGGQGGACSSA